MEWTEILNWIGGFWAFSSIGVPAIIEFIFTKIKEPATKTWKSIWSWAIPIILVYILWALGGLFGAGFLIGYELWWSVGLIGAFSALVANVTWTSTPWIKEAIIQIIALLPKFKPVEEPPVTTTVAPVTTTEAPVTTTEAPQEPEA